MWGGEDEAQRDEEGHDTDAEEDDSRAVALAEEAWEDHLEVRALLDTCNVVRAVTARAQERKSWRHSDLMWNMVSYTSIDSQHSRLISIFILIPLHYMDIIRAAT